jgi:hypothetical protein
MVASIVAAQQTMKLRCSGALHSDETPAGRAPPLKPWDGVGVTVHY